MLGKLNQVLSLFTTERPELSVLDVAARLDRPLSTVYRLLSNIHREGFLDRNEVSGEYRLGILLAVLGDLATRSTSLQQLVIPVMRRLSEQTGETATLLMLQGGEGVAVNHVESNLPVMMKGVLGRYWPLHASAGGKVFLTWLPESQRRALLARPLKAYTSRTITERRALARELEQARGRGFTTVRGEFLEEVWGVAAPVWDHRGELQAAITLGGPRSRVTPARLPVLGRAAIDACESVSRALGYRGEYHHDEGRRGKGAIASTTRGSSDRRSREKSDRTSRGTNGRVPRTVPKSAPRKRA